MWTQENHFLVFTPIAANRRKILCSPRVPRTNIIVVYHQKLHEISVWEIFELNSSDRIGQQYRMYENRVDDSILVYTPFVRDLAIVNRTCWRIHWIRGEHNARKRLARDVFLSIGITTWNFEPCRFAFNWVHQIQFAAFNRPLVDKFKAFNAVTHVEADEKEWPRKWEWK